MSQDLWMQLELILCQNYHDALSGLGQAMGICIGGCVCVRVCVNADSVGCFHMAWIVCL